MKNDPLSVMNKQTLWKTPSMPKSIWQMQKENGWPKHWHWVNDRSRTSWITWPRLCVPGEDLVPEQKGQMATPIASRFGLLALTGSQRRFWRYGAASTPDIGSSRAVWQFLWTFWLILLSTLHYKSKKFPTFVRILFQNGNTYKLFFGKMRQIKMSKMNGRSTNGN